MKLTIHPIPTLKDNYVWTIIDTTQRVAIIVDPGEASPVINYLKIHQLSLIAILITHHHWDHTNGIAGILEHVNVPVYGPKNVAHISHPVTEGDSIQLKDFPFTINVLAIPGHTLDHLAYHCIDLLFCGDTLFSAGCGRLFEGSAAQMYSSLQKLAALPDDTKVCCAHEYTLNNLNFAKTIEPNNECITKLIQSVAQLREQDLPSLPSTLKRERETNPFLRCDTSTVKESVENIIGHRLNDPIAIFAALRKCKDNFR